jgi:hypothetical protein
VALRTTLEQLVEMTLDAVGASSATSRNNDYRQYVIRQIQRVYETLCDDFDWTFLRVSNDEAMKEVEAGERYYDFPVAMDMRNVVECWYFYNSVWVPLTYGIGPEQYTAMNPELNQRADPAIRWRDSSERQFEIWPLPASNGNIVMFRGRRLPTPLTSDTARADMDDQLIVLYTAAEILAKSNQKDAELKLAAANARKIRMRALYSDKNKVRMGMGQSWEQDQRGWPRIRAFPASN